MTVLDELAGFVHDFDIGALPAETLERLELHLLDTLGAVMTGSELAETRAIGKLAGPGDALVLVAAARATEMDDIHLSSCTTPGSVVVGTALSLVAERAITSPKDLLASLAVGYEAMVRLGLAIDGPSVLGQGVWPTLFAAPLGSAAVACRALGLSSEQTAGALATALALTAGTPTRAPRELSSRWLTLGAAARRGLLAARSASGGLGGSSSILEQLGSRIAGVSIAPEVLASELGEAWLIDEVVLKPYPIARQALAAVEACRELAARHQLEPEAIDEIVVYVPEPQRRVIDRPEVPETRFASVVSVQYLVSLSIVSAEKLEEVRRPPPFVVDTIRSLMRRVRVEEDADLARHYPKAWPARVSLRRGSEMLHHEILHPRGDRETGFSWNDVAAKYSSAVPDRSQWKTLTEAIRAVHESPELPSSLSDVI